MTQEDHWELAQLILHEYSTTEKTTKEEEDFLNSDEMPQAGFPVQMNWWHPSRTISEFFFINTSIRRHVKKKKKKKKNKEEVDENCGLKTSVSIIYSESVRSV